MVVAVPPDGNCFFSAIAAHTVLSEKEKQKLTKHEQPSYFTAVRGALSSRRWVEASNQVRWDLASYIIRMAFPSEASKITHDRDDSKCGHVLDPSAKVDVTNALGKDLQERWEILRIAHEGGPMDFYGCHRTLAETVNALCRSSDQGGVWGDAELLGDVVARMYRRPFVVHMNSDCVPPIIFSVPDEKGPAQAAIEVVHSGMHFEALVRVSPQPN